MSTKCLGCDGVPDIVGKLFYDLCHDCQKTAGFDLVRLKRELKEALAMDADEALEKHNADLTASIVEACAKALDDEFPYGNFLRRKFNLETL